MRQIKALKEKPKEELNAEQVAKIKKHKELVDEIEKHKRVRDQALKELEAPAPKKKAPAPKAPEPEPEEEEEDTEDDPFAVDRTILTALFAEFERAQEMKKKITLGKIKKPTLQQEKLAKQTDILQKGIDREQLRIENEVKRLRVEAGLPAEEEPEPEPELSDTEKRILELTDLKNEAKDADDFAAAGKYKAMIDRLERGEPEEEPIPEPEPEPEVVPEPEPEPEEPAEPEPEPEEEPTPEPEPEEEPIPEPEPEPEVEEPEPEPEVIPEPPKKVKLTPDHPDYSKGITIVKNTKKPGGGGGGAASNGIELDLSAEPKASYEELMSRMAKKEASQPYEVTFDSQPAAIKKPERAAARESSFAKVATRRLMKDLCDLQDCPLYTVKAEPTSDIFTWHANVSPTEGPYAGFVVRFVIYFPDSYPMEPPVVRCCSPIHHPYIQSSARYADKVCLEVSKEQKGGWSPAYPVRTILAHLGSMFSQEYFREEKRAVSQKFLNLDRVHVQEYQCKETGHSLKNPFPAIPCFNGPFTDDMVPELKVEQGCVWSESKKAAHFWMHNYTGKGKHYFRCVLRHRGEHEAEWGLGWSTPEGDLVDLGQDDQTWCYEPASGKLLHNGEAVESGVTAEAGDIVDCFLSIDSGEISFSVNGTEIEHKLSGVTAEALYHPAFVLGNGSGCEMIFVPNAAALPVASLPIACVSSVRDNSPRCAILKEDAETSVLGVGLKVSRDSNGLPITIAADSELISQEAFTKGNRRSVSDGGAIEAFLPLMLGPHHGVKVRPLLEKAVAGVMRNPKAALPSYYTPPFKAANVNFVMPLIVKSAVTTLVDHLEKDSKAPRDHAVQKASVVFSHITHAYKSIASIHSKVAEDAEKTIDEEIDQSHATALVLAVLGIEREGAFQDLLKRMLAGSETLQAAFKEKRKALRALVVFEVYRSLYSGATLEGLMESQGRPSTDNIEGLRKALTILAGATSVEEVCFFPPPFFNEETSRSLMLCDKRM